MDPDVRDVVSALRRRRSGGQELLAWKEGRAWVDVDARVVNGFIKDHAGQEHSAKDFRTWHATVLAAVGVAVAGWASSPTARRRNEARAAKEVAHYLGNTPTVARNSYIDPRVFDRYRAGYTIGWVIDEIADADSPQLAFHGPIEEAVVDLLTDHREADTVIKGPLL